MERDNSNSKSKLQRQRESMNEELMKFNDSISLGMRTIEDNIVIEEMVKWILELYHQDLVQIKENLLVTEKVLSFKGQNHIDYSEHTNILRQKEKELEKEEFEKYAKQYFEEIEPKLIKQMQEWLDLILKRLNEVVLNYTFYLKSVKIKNIYFGPYNFRLETSFDCTIDIK